MTGAMAVQENNELCFNFDINHDVDLTISPFCPQEEAEREIQ